jgi:hypothetical protein
MRPAQTRQLTTWYNTNRRSENSVRAERDGADQPQAVEVLQQQDGGHGTGFDQPLDLCRTGSEGSRTQSESAAANRPADREPEATARGR